MGETLFSRFRLQVDTRQLGSLAVPLSACGMLQENLTVHAAPPPLFVLLQQTAHVNASYQAAEGLPPGIFTAKVPVYTGHYYHMPHVVPNTNISYIGSPYQGGWGHIEFGESCMRCIAPLGYGCT